MIASIEERCASGALCSRSAALDDRFARGALRWMIASLEERYAGGKKGSNHFKFTFHILS
jgi:hypothetical protein